MKKSLFIIILIYIFASSIGYTQNKAKSDLCVYNEKLMVGTWKMDTIYLKENINLGDYKELYDQKFRELKDSTVFYFRNDYTYERVAKGQSTKGTWSISNDGTLIIVKMIGKEAEEKSRILELTKTNLVMSPMSESSNSKVVMHKVIDNE